ncbi:MAG TPA: Gfo/Idh/MocA family oxidoreductase [Sedimentisphaerales bacterium]|nr:Gfo/Idh/MocA family oxidoreductase [Sedimentisphaerales bacterium]
MRQCRISRREFLKQATSTAVGALGFPYLVSSSALGKVGRVAAGDRIVMGVIGVGGRGRAVMQSFLELSDAQVVAVCDVNKERYKLARRMVDEKYNKKVCKTYHDFSELLSRPDIDAVLIASPVFWHVIMATEAAKQGKDMYMEKPVGLSFAEAKILRQTIHRYGRVFQFGTQQRSGRNFRFACELALNGRIGKVHTIMVGVPAGDFNTRFPQKPVPQGLDYQAWLGPAQWSPFTEAILNGWTHELISLYSLGFISAWGVHHLDIAQWGNGTELTGPTEIEGKAVFPDEGVLDCAKSWQVNLRYPNGVTIHFTDNTKNRQGVRFEGENGWVHVNRQGISASPASLLKETMGPDEIHLPVSDNHSKNLLDCMRTRQQTVAPVDVAVRSDTLCQLSDIAVRLGRRLKWNPGKEEFIDDAQASRMLTRPMRSPWRL